MLRESPGGWLRLKPASGTGREEGAASGILPGQVWGRGTGRRELDGTPHPTADPPALVPTPSPRRRRPSSPDSAGEAWAGSCPRSPPRPGSPPSPPAFTCRAAAGRRSRPSRAARGARAAGGGVVGVRAGGLRVALPAALAAAGVGGRRGEARRREGRGGAGPPPSSFHSHRQGPRPAWPAHPARPRRQPPSGDPL